MLKTRKKVAIKSFESKLLRLKEEKQSLNWNNIFAGILENINIYFGEGSSMSSSVKYLAGLDDSQRRDMFINLCTECINHIKETGLPPKKNIIHTIENWKIYTGAISILGSITLISFNFGYWKASLDNKEREIEYKNEVRHLKDSLLIMKHNNPKALIVIPSSKKIIPNKNTK